MMSGWIWSLEDSFKQIPLVTIVFDLGAVKHQPRWWPRKNCWLELCWECTAVPKTESTHNLYIYSVWCHSYMRWLKPKVFSFFQASQKSLHSYEFLCILAPFRLGSFWKSRVLGHPVMVLCHPKSSNPTYRRQVAYSFRPSCCRFAQAEVSFEWSTWVTTNSMGKFLQPFNIANMPPPKKMAPSSGHKKDIPNLTWKNHRCMT